MTLYVFFGNRKNLDEVCLRNRVLKKIFVRKEGGCIEMFIVVCKGKGKGVP